MAGSVMIILVRGSVKLYVSMRVGMMGVTPWYGSTPSAAACCICTAVGFLPGTCLGARGSTRRLSSEYLRGPNTKQSKAKRVVSEDESTGIVKAAARVGRALFGRRCTPPRARAVRPSASGPLSLVGRAWGGTRARSTGVHLAGVHSHDHMPQRHAVARARHAHRGDRELEHVALLRHLRALDGERREGRAHAAVLCLHHRRGGMSSRCFFPSSLSSPGRKLRSWVVLTTRAMGRAT